MLDVTNIPEDLRERAKSWYSAQVKRLASLHGDKWPEHREWLEDFLNAEVQELVWKAVQDHAV